MRPLLLLFFFSTLSIFSFAQNDWCATDEMLEEYLNASPQNRAQYEQQQENIRQLSKTIKNDKAGNTIIIPVVVHVIHDNGIGNISKAQIEDGISILNRDLKKQNADTSFVRSVFQPYISDLNVEFRLAKIDPNGNCTEGITRTSSKQTYNARDNVKPVSRWPYSSYFNVWLVESINSSSSIGGTVLGYAQFPGGGNLNTYGIVVRNDEWGSIGTAQGSNGRTVTHEVGHCFGLLHTFQSGCGNDCSTSGDQVCDTPPVAQATWGCNKNHNSCTNDSWGFSPYTTNVQDMLENYMSYDDCQYMFTDGQRLRVNTVFNSNFPELMNLSTQSNLVATGTDDNHVPQICAPTAEIIRDRIFRCVGTNIIFEEQSYGAPITGWNWSFPGGTPSTSTDSTPVVHYNSPGTYSYSLVVSSTGGSDTLTLVNEVVISDTTADYLGYNYKESFENAGQFVNDWTIEDNGGHSDWQRISTSAYDGNASMFLNNYLQFQPGEVDAIVSPSLDLTTVQNPKLKFNLAYRKRQNDNSDVLRVYFSTNCGQNYSTFYLAYPFGLLNPGTPNNGGWFVPQSQADWKEFTVTIPAAAANNDNVKLKFEITSGGGNNIYLDNIRIDGNANGQVGIVEVDNKTTLQIYPNPASSYFTLQVDLKESSNVQIELKNLLGKTVKTISNKNFSADSYRFQVETDDLASGIYLVNLIVGNENVTRKLVVQ